MTFAALLMASDPRRSGWIKVGRSLVAVDSLVHNFLHRTGILAAFDRPHLYRARCYRPDGCTGVVHELAARVDASQINPIRIDHCRTRHKKKLGTTVEHVLSPSRIIRIALKN